MPADLGKSDFFVIEADEYDSAFFDKRSKLFTIIRGLWSSIILNLITQIFFQTWHAIQNQFHHLIFDYPIDWPDYLSRRRW